MKIATLGPIVVWSITSILILMLPATIRGEPLYPLLTTNRHITSIIFWALLGISLIVRTRKTKMVFAGLALTLVAGRLVATKLFFSN